MFTFQNQRRRFNVYEGQQSYNHNYDLSYYFTRWAKIRKKVQSREATSRLASRAKIKVIDFF